MWLPWTWGVVVALGALGSSVGLTRWVRSRYASGVDDPSVRRVDQLGAVLRETAIVMFLYSLWQVAGSWSVMGVQDALARARWIVHAERYLPIPSESAVQALLLPYPTIVRAANLYYAVAHVPCLVATLIWGFLAHRQHYRLLRSTLALTTLGCLLIQLVPVAPPRMLDELGFTDTALVYGQSVYSALGRGMAGQLAAMPSVHVAWALIVMWFAFVVPTRPVVKVICALHAAITLVVVVATANHFWLDGIVAGWLQGLSLLLIALTARVSQWLRVQMGGLLAEVPGRRLGRRFSQATPTVPPTTGS